jgi:hypothetical protein
MFSLHSFAQLTGTVSVPSVAYPTIQSVVTDLNTNGVGAGGVVVNIDTGYVETLTAPIVLTATGTVSNPITFQKFPVVGPNPRIIAHAGANTPASATTDGLFALEGSDFVTIDGINLEDPNIVTVAMMEYGYGLFKASASDGCQNVKIRNCVITLNRGNFATGAGVRVEGSVGIAVYNSTRVASTNLTVTSATGANSNIKISSNTIQNCNYGIVMIGFAAATPFTLADTNNDIGGTSSATGNTIINFGGGTGSTNPAAAIRTLAQYNFNASYNTINNNTGVGVNHPSTLRGIYLNTATSASAIISFNSISMRGGGTTTIVTAIENVSGSTAASNTINISNNTISCRYLTATSGEMRGIHNNATPQNLLIQQNTINDWVYSASTLTGSGANYPIHNASAGIFNHIRNNTITNVFRTGTSGGTTVAIFASSGANGTNTINANKNTIRGLRIDGTGSSNIIYGIQLGSGTVRADSNTIDSLHCIKVTGTGAIYGIYNIASPNNENYNFNKISNLKHNGTGIIYGFYSFTSTGVRQVSNNEIWNLSGNSTVGGILNTSSVSTVFRNNVYNLTSTTQTAIVFGIGISSSTTGTNSFFNNLISNLSAPAGNNGTASPNIRGINLTSTSASTNIQVHHNTILLGGTGNGVGNLSSTALFHTDNTTNTSANLNLRNNILINNVVPFGTGISSAIWVSGANLSNYATTSNRNILYAGTPSPNNVLVRTGTVSYQTISSLSAIATRESESQTENTVFVSTTPGTSGYLIPSSVQSFAESGATPIAGFVSDFALDSIRAVYPQTGQVNGGGSFPDIGAYEYDGIPYPTCNGVPPNIAISGANAVCSGTSTMLNIAGLPANTIGFTYQWQVADSVNAVVFTNLQTGTSQSTGNLTTPKFYRANVGCSFGGSPAQTPVFGVAINTLPTITITESTDTVCAPGFAPISLVASGATTYTWSPVSSLNASTGDTVLANPTNTTTYTATGTDGFGCSNTATKTVNVFFKPVISPTATPANACIGNNIQLNANDDVANLLITEVTVFRIGTGATNPYPAHITGADLVEISNISNNPIDVSGFLIRAFGDNSATASHSLTFPAGTIIPAQSVLVVHLGLGTDNPALLYFNTGGASDSYASSSRIGIVLSNGSKIIDAVGLGGSLTGSYTFNAALGIQASQWSGFAPNATGLAGSRRVASLDSNTGADWLESGPSNIQNIGTYSPIFLFFFNTYAWTPVSGLNDATSRTPIFANIQNTTTFNVNVLSSNGCSSSAQVTATAAPLSQVNFNFSVNDTVCTNTAQTITVVPANGGAPYHYLWNTGDTLATINSNVAAATAYSVRIIDSCGDTLNASTGVVTIPRPSVAITSSQVAICNPGGVATQLIATGAESYAWAPSTGLNVNNNDTVSALPSATTLYTVTGTGANGCTNTANYNVVVSAAINSLAVTSVDTAVCSGGNTSLNAVATVPISAYCIPTYANGNTFGDFISNVSIAGTTLSNIANVNNPNVFTLFPASGNTTAELVAGTSYNITLGGGSFSSAYVRVWIDYNQNGVFETSESVVITGNIGALATTTLPFTVPANAPNGQTRMRVRSSDTAPGPSDTQACGATNSSYGEAEDYIITIIGGVSPLSYTWATNASLSANNIANPAVNNLTATTFFAVTATTNDGCSRTDSVRVVAAPIPAQPAASDEAICPTTTATLSATGTGTLGWYDAAVSGNYLGGGSSYTTMPLSVNTNYYVQDSSSYGCISTRKMVSVIMEDSIVITTNPIAAITQCEFTTLNLSGNATGAGLSYQWVKDGQNINGATSNTFSIASLSPTDAGTYSLTAIGDCNIRSTSNALVTIDPAIFASVGISSSSTSVCGGAAITFTANPTNGGSTPQYQWFKNGSAVSGATSSTYVLNSPADNDSIYVQMTSNATPCLQQAVVASNAVVLTNSTVTPSVAVTASATTICAGSNVVFTTQASNTGSAPVYAWMINGNSVGATGSSFATTSLQNNDVVTVMMTSNAACTSTPTATSAPVSMTVNQPTVITTQPMGVVACEGTAANLSVTATGSGTLIYQWRRNGNNITGATNATLAIANLSAGDAGTYSVLVNGTCGSVTSQNASITVNPATAILTQPSSATICQGAGVVLSVNAVGTQPLTYQWRKDGNIINGAVGNTYILNNAQVADAGSYTVEINGGCNNLTSAAAVVTVNPSTVIATQPSAVTICAGGNASMTVAATGAGTLSYQWFLNGTPVNGATNATINIPNITTATQGAVTVAVTGTCGTITSNAAQLTVNSVTAITAQPVSATLCAGSVALFSVSATGSGTLTYQWKRAGNNIAGAISNVLVVNNISAADAGTYTVDVTGTCGTVTSNAATLTVNPQTVITTQPSAVTICAGGNASMTVAATGSGTLAYQWFLNGTTVSGATSATINIPNITTATQGAVTVAVTGTCGTVTSSPAQLTVNPATTITLQPASVTACAGGNVTLSVGATGAGVLTYQWKRNGNNVAGANGATLSLNGVTAAQAGNYTVDVIGSCGTVTSSSATVTVNALTTITTQPTNVTVCENGTASMNVVAAGAGTLTYQWFLNGTTVPGATNASISIPNITTATQGAVTVAVTGSCGTVTSQVANLVVNSNTAIISQPAAVTACAGGNALLSVTASGSGFLTYQWKFNGNNIAGANASTLILNNLSALNAGNYTVDVTGVCGTVTSSVAAVVVNATTVITAQPANVTVCEGGTASMSVTAVGEGQLTYQWFLNGTAVQGANGATITIPGITTATQGSVSVAVTGACGTVMSANANLVVNVNPQASFNVSGACEGAMVNFHSTSTISAGFIASHIWNFGNGMQGTGSMATSMYDTAGTYTVVLTAISANGCSSTSTQQITINENPSVSVSAATAICAGASATLTATGADSYNWMPSAGLSSTNGASVTASPATTTIYMVIGTDANGCSDTAMTTVTVNENPVVNLGENQTICITSSVTLDAGNAGSTYEWINGATTQSVTFAGADLGTGSHTISVVVTNSNGCKGSDDVVIFVNPCTSVDEVSANVDMNVYPNPSKGLINIAISGVNTSETIQMTIIDQFGKVINQRSIAAGVQQFTEDLSNQKAGVYFVRLVINGQSMMRRVVLQ